MKPATIRDLNWQQLHERVRGLRLAVLEALRMAGPCTTRELAARSGLDLLTVRPRVTELEQLGFVECIGGGSEGIYRVRTHDELLAHFRAEQALARGEGVQQHLPLA
jgi:DNA-binding IclR family transcriptional regulator